MNDYRIIISHRARSDLLDINTYITYQLLEPDISRNLIKGLRKSISQLSFFPYGFPLIQNEILHSKAVRCMPYKNFYIFYEIVETMHVIVVLRIGYNKRNWKNF